MRLAEREDLPSPDACLRIAAALERHSAHPFAAAFDDVGDVPVVSDVSTVPGRGIEGTIDGRRWRIGRIDFAAPRAAGDAATLNGGRIALGDEHGAVALFELSDELRNGAREAIASLQQQGLEISLASGDAAAVVERAASDLGIADARWRQSPQDKLDLLRGLQDAGHTVIMVGDGVNDAPVLAGANASVAMGSGTMLARTSAGAVLLGGHLPALPQAVALARHTRRTVRQNLLWAAVYNAAAVPLAASGHVPPWLAAIGMSASSLVVVLNALRLRRSRPAAPADRSRDGSDRRHATPSALGNVAP
jgi:Cu2+-exporting ATPase